MITLFTTTKAFTGIFDVIQSNALMNWAGLSCKPEIIVFGDAPGLEEMKEKVSFKHIPDVKTLNGRIPYINHMFNIASKEAKHETLCFLNADILLTDQIVKGFLNIHNKLKKEYLVVGQRFDVDIKEKLEFSGTWESDFLRKYKSDFKVHTPTGSDFFLFPKGQYSLDNMPDLLVGRPGWDLWMIYNGRRRGLKVVDYSLHDKVIHQNHDYSHKVKDKNLQKAEDEHNYKFLPEKEKYVYQLNACNYLFSEGKIKRNFARGDIEAYQNFQLKLNSGSPLKRFYYKLEPMFLKFFSKSQQG